MHAEHDEEVWRAPVVISAPLFPWLPLFSGFPDDVFRLFRRCSFSEDAQDAHNIINHFIITSYSLYNSLLCPKGGGKAASFVHPFFCPPIFVQPFFRPAVLSSSRWHRLGPSPSPQGAARSGISGKTNRLANARTGACGLTGGEMRTVGR